MAVAANGRRSYGSKICGCAKLLVHFAQMPDQIDLIRTDVYCTAAHYMLCRYANSDVYTALLYTPSIPDRCYGVVSCQVHTCIF